jgi:hypothetical protein
MLLTPEKLYFELGRLIGRMPELGSGPVKPETQRWLQSAIALVGSSGSLADALQLAAACENLDGPLRARNVETITNILHRALAKAELSAPPDVQGSVILVGGDFDAYMAVRQLLGSATADALLVEPDAASKVLADYATLAPEMVAVRILADEAQYKPSLIKGVQRWEQRFGRRRSLMVRLTRANTLHERLMLLDRASGWVLGMPLSSLATQTRTTLIRMRPEEQAHKIAVYAEIWEEAEPLRPRGD